MNIKNKIREYFQIRREAISITLKRLDDDERFIYISYKTLWSCFFLFLIMGIITLTFLFVRKSDIFGLTGLLFLGLLFIFSMSLIVFFSDNQTLIHETDGNLKNLIPSLHYERYENGKTHLSSAMSKWLTLNHPDNYSMDQEVRNHYKQYRVFSKIMKHEINHQDNNGDTILHYMLQTDPHSPFIAKALLMNADIHIKNNKGISAYDLLIKYNPEYIAFIEKTLLRSATSVKPEKRNINRL